MAREYKRLDLIKSLIRENERVIDIGTDHALLPIMLVQDKITRNVSASEVADGPYEIAKESIYKAELQDVIKLIKSDGFENVSNRKYDTIIIAGMGGHLITKILSKKNLKLRQRLIIHATNNHYVLRKKLSKMGYEITNEFMVEEGKAKNIIIEADRNVWNTRLTKTERYHGPKLIEKVSEKHINTYFQDQLKYFKDLYEKSGKKEFLVQIKMIEKILK